MKADRFDTVRLKDGRKGVIVDVYDDPPGFEIDFSINETFENLTEGVACDMVDEVIR